MTRRVLIHIPGFLCLVLCAAAIVYYLIQGVPLGSIPLPFIAIFAALTIIAMLISDQAFTKTTHTNSDKKQAEPIQNPDLRINEIRKENAAQLAESNRLAEFGKVSAGLFHDLMNPLAALTNTVEQLGKGVSETQLAELTQYSTEAAKRIRHILTSVKEILYSDHSTALFSPSEAVREILNLFTHTMRIAAIESNIAIPDTLRISGRRDIFMQIMMNLISNSIESMTDQAGSKSLSIRSHTSMSFIWIHVSDSGRGIPTDIKEKIGHMPVTTKSNGIGIGLYQSKRLLESEFGGEMAIESNEGKGTIVSIKIPLQETQT